MPYLNFYSKNSMFVFSNLKHSLILSLFFLSKRNILNDSTSYDNFISF
ncbi:hypothetical protein R4J17_10630 [Brachyspira intermedia]